MKALRLFLTSSTESERERLAKGAGTTVPYLYAIAGGHRDPKIETIAAIERSSITISKRSKGRLPILPRTEISPACAACPFAKACKKPETA